MKTSIGLLVIPITCVLLLIHESESSSIGDMILAIPEDTAMSRLDLFPAVRTLVRVMRMVNRPAAKDRIREGLKKMIHKEPKPLEPLNNANKAIKRMRFLRRVMHIFGQTNV